MLGTGGNDGRLDFSTNFHQQLMTSLRHFRQSARACRWPRARDLLDGTQTDPVCGCCHRPVRSRQRRRAGLIAVRRGGLAGQPVELHPVVEGALLFAASAAAATSTPRAGPPCRSPSTRPRRDRRAGRQVRSRAAKSGPRSGRGFTLAEIKQLFAEARASWRGRPARRAVDFYAATRTLGVTRGIDEFTRYGLQRRNGLAFAAVPLDRVSSASVRPYGWPRRSRTGSPGRRQRGIQGPRRRAPGFSRPPTFNSPVTAIRAPWPRCSLR